MSQPPEPEPDAPASPTPADEVSVRAAYEEIRRLARRHLRGERVDHTLAPTALANEAWLRLHGPTPQFATDAEFVAAAVNTLRRILVEHGRRRRRLKRGGGRRRVAIEADELPAEQRGIDERVIDLDAALERLAAVAPDKARLVELRFFGGMEVDEAATVLGISPRTAARDWRVARAFLRAELGEGGDDALVP